MATILRMAVAEARALCQQGRRCWITPSCSSIINSNVILSRQFGLSGTIQGITPMELLMPALSPTMEVGTIKKWLKEEGETVSVGDALCEVETDKATVTMDADEDGIMAKILVTEGTSDIKINTLIALMVTEGEDYNDVNLPVSSTPDVGTQTGDIGVHQLDVTTHSLMSSEMKSLSPAVRYLIDTHNLDASRIIATGPNNRILKGDVLTYMLNKPVPKMISQQLKSSLQTDNQKRMSTTKSDFKISNVKSTVPHAYATIECTIDAILKLRKTFLKDRTKLSVNDFVIKATAIALKKHPDVNAQLKGEDVVNMPSIDISVAVATEQGLITPIVTNAASKGLKQISDNVRDLAARAREGKLQLHEFQGGSFSISNLGMFGISEFSAVINPPQTCILAVGTSKLRLSDRNQAATVITLTLSSDARVVDDSLAAAFLQSLKFNLENPMRLGLL